MEQPSTIHGNTFKLGNDTSVGLVLKFPSKNFLLPEIYGQTSKNSLPLLVKNFNYTSKNFLPLLVKIFNTQSITIKNNSQSNKKINKKRESVSEKPKTEKPNEFNPRSVELPACVDPELWNNFVDMRVSIKKPLSENAVKLILKKEMATDIKKLFEALTQHQAYLYRASSKTVNELLALFNDDTSKMLSKLRDLLDELNESEKVALAGGKYTTSNLREIRDLIAQWFASVNLALPEAFAVSATALAVYEANYVAKLYGAKINKPDGEKLFLSAKKVPLAGGALVDELLSRIAESARQKVEYAIRD
ncbi:hypothetical protein ACVN8O_18760, partial [Acinetobacter baumannii]